MYNDLVECSKTHLAQKCIIKRAMESSQASVQITLKQQLEAFIHNPVEPGRLSPQ